jgi:cell division protein FtsB
MTPASAMMDERTGLRPVPLSSELRARRKGRVRRFVRSRALAWVLTLLVTAGAVAGGLLVVGQRQATIASLRQELTVARAQLTTATQRGDVSGGTIQALRTKVAGLQKELSALKARGDTVVKQETVTKTVTKWVPNGEGVHVEVTGYEGMIQLRDVQITQSYGYTDLIGIAVNTSGRTLSYAQLGCSFLDENGTVLANQIDNKQNWLPDQTWGFDCSGQVRATGGILRVDELG